MSNNANEPKVVKASPNTQILPNRDTGAMGRLDRIFKYPIPHMNVTIEKASKKRRKGIVIVTGNDGTEVRSDDYSDSEVDEIERGHGKKGTGLTPFQSDE
jgi:hypothetical protein